jgi:hypothetical protein
LGREGIHEKALARISGYRHGDRAIRRRLNLLAKTTIPTTKPHFPDKTNDPRPYLDELADEIRLSVRTAGEIDANLAGLVLRIIERNELIKALEYVIGSDNINRNDPDAVQTAKLTLKNLKPTYHIRPSTRYRVLFPNVHVQEGL